MLRVRLLGTLELREEDRLLPRPPTLKSQALLAYLLLHRRQPLTRDRLGDLFWGERPENKARHSLATALWHIRRCLPDERMLLSDPQTVQFDPLAELWLDVEAFARLASSSEAASLDQAAHLYRGEFLDGFFDDWVISERYRLETLWVEALTRLMAAQESAADHWQTLTTALRLIAVDPLREDAHRAAMRAFCRLGQRNAALDQYERCRQVMQAELDAAPEAATTELYESIRSGRYAVGHALAVAGAAPIPEQAPAAINPLEAWSPVRMVGRDAELAYLHQRWERARAGQGRLVLVQGEAGMGKTRLVEEFAQQLRWQGRRVLWGRCYEFERILPYQPVAEALRTLLPVLAPAELAALPSRVLAGVSWLAPEFGEQRPGHLPASPSVPGSDPHFDGVVRFLAELAAHAPLLLVLEDVHWATEPTLEMVHYLARSLATRPVLILLTLRPEALEPQHPLIAIRRRLGRDGLLDTIVLPPLAPEAVSLLVAEMSGASAAAPLAERLYQESEGNPFYLNEMIRALFETGTIHLEGGVWEGDFVATGNGRLPAPASLGETILARAQRVGPRTQEALQVAAVLGREFDFDLLNAVWAQGEEATLTAIEDLLRHRLVQEGTGALGRDYAFCHHKIQEVVCGSLPQRRRQHVHARVAAAMEAANSTADGAMAGELAYHFEQGRGRDSALAAKALYYLWLSGDQARILYAAKEAIDYYQRALVVANDLGDEEAVAHTLLRLGQTQHSIFSFEAAAQAYDEAFIRWQRTEAASAHSSALPPAPHPLRLLWVHYPVTFDPILGDAGITHHVFSGLVEESPEMEVIPDAAWRWELLDGGRRYVFHLRPDAVWTDGTPVSAADFEFAWKRVLAQRESPAARFLYDVEGAQALHEGLVDDASALGVRALDDHTLAVTLAAPAAYFLHLMALPVSFPIPRHAVKRWGEAWSKPEHIASNGAFRLLSWQPGDRIVLARNSGYRGRFTGNLQDIHLLLNQEARNDWRAARALYADNAIDAWMLGNMPQAALEEVDRRFRAERKLVRLYYTNAVGFDVGQPPFDDVRVRQAFALASDVKTVRDEQHKEHWVADQGGWIPAGMPGHTANACLPFDPLRARQLLADAGFPEGRGFPTVRYRTFRTPETEQTLPAIIAFWRRVLGVDVTPEVSERSAYLAELAADPAQLFAMSWWASYPDPDEPMRMGMAQVRRFTHWHNADFQQTVEDARHVLDPEARLRLYRSADALLLREAPVCPWFYPQVPFLVKPWVQHHTMPPTQGERGWKAIVLAEH